MDRESTIYGAIVGVCESIERSERAVGNGHHLAQELAGLAERAIAERKDAPPAFPPEVMEAAREALRLDTGTIDAIGPLADLAVVLARAILGACPHALTTSRLADGELAPDEAKAAREHVAGCGACRETLETALQLAALADASNH